MWSAPRTLSFSQVLTPYFSFRTGEQKGTLGNNTDSMKHKKKTQKAIVKFTYGDITQTHTLDLTEREKNNNASKDYLLAYSAFSILHHSRPYPIMA